MNYCEHAAIAAHAIRISCNCKDNSPILLYQVYQSACEPAVFFSNRMARVTRVSGVSGVSLFQVCSVFGADTEQIAPFNFGVAEFILTFVVDAVIVGQFGSWMIFVSLTLFLFARRRKGCESSWRLHNAFQISGNWSKLASNIGESKAL